MEPLKSINHLPSPTIIIDLSTLVFIRHQDSGALFQDGDGDLILLMAGGNQANRAEAVRQINRAINQPHAVREPS